MTTAATRLEQSVPIEDQDVAAGAALVCHRGPNAGYQAEWTFLDSIEQVREAEAELTPCGPSCIKVQSALRIPNTTTRPGTATTTRTRT